MNCMVCGGVGKGERMGMHKSCMETYILDLQVLQAKQMLEEPIEHPDDQYVVDDPMACMTEESEWGS